MRKDNNGIYISGKISNLDENHARELFNDAERMLCVAYPNRIVINPFNIRPLFGIKKYWFFMIADIYYLIFHCSDIFLLDNWKESKGAKIELCVALLLNKTVL